MFKVPILPAAEEILTMWPILLAIIDGSASWVQ